MTHAHAKLSPSAATRWMTCPGSVKLIAQTPMVRRSSEAADRGTAIHELSEKALTENKNCSDYIGQTFCKIVIDADMAACGQFYVDYVKSLSGKKYYEQKVSIERLIENCYGTADCLVVDKTLLRVVDLKTGVYPVKAYTNRQLLIYGLGAYYKLKAIYDFETVSLEIVQPQGAGVDTWEISVEDLLEFELDLVTAKDLIENQPDKFVTSEDACKYCPVVSKCPEHIALANAAAMSDFKTATQDMTQLSYWLDRIKQLKDFIDAVETVALADLSEGKSVPGYKLVEGRSSRKWGDLQALENFIRAKKLESVMYKTELLSVAQAEKVLKDKKIVVDEFVEIVPGKPSVAKDSDKRKSLTSSEFKDVK
jgi:RecB family exonuclease